MSDRLKVWGAGIVAIALAMAMVVVAQAAEPAPQLTYSKSVASSNHYIEWTLEVTNSGDADSDSQTVQDTLPAGADWYIADSNIRCELNPSSIAGRLKLDCAEFIVPKVDLDGVDTAGHRYVIIAGVVDECGIYTNRGVFTGGIQREASINIACPATPTPVPTSTPQPTATPTTPIQNAATPTATTTRFVPLPPNTGNSSMEDPAGKKLADTLLIGALIGVTIIVGMSASTVIYRRVKARGG